MPSWPAPWTRICPEASTYRRPLRSRLREPSSTEWRKARRTSSRIPCRSPWRRAGATVRPRRWNARMRRWYKQSQSSRRQSEGTRGNNTVPTPSKRSRESNGAGNIVLNADQRRNQDVNEHDRETAHSVAGGMACGSHEPIGQRETIHARARCVGFPASADAVARRGEAVRVRWTQRQSEPAPLVRGPPSTDRLPRLLLTPPVRLAPPCPPPPL